MLKKRIIPCLDIKNGRTVKGIHFEDLVDAGDPIELAKKYVDQGADELVFLDISATEEKRKTRLSLVERIAKNINIPFSVGGGINSVVGAKEVILSGADKISLNSSAVKRPELIQEISTELGSQAVIVAIDCKCTDDNWMVYIQGGKIPTGLATINWAKKAQSFGAGEILLTSMNNDGTKKGFALDITKQVSESLHIPVIASGGAGKKEHFKDVFQKTRASGALAASVFHYGEISLDALKKKLKNENISIR